MKITQADQQKLESLMLSSAKAHECESIADFIAKMNASAPNAIAKAKSPEVWILSILIKGEALLFVCDVIYNYADSSHVHTFLRALYKKHSA